MHVIMKKTIILSQKKRQGGLVHKISQNLELHVYKDFY